ncbi:hypothetical protein D9M73_216390 [compost metagenome]
MQHRVTRSHRPWGVELSVGPALVTFVLEQLLGFAFVNPGAGSGHVILQRAQLGHGGLHQRDALVGLVVGAGHFTQGDLDAVFVFGDFPVFGLGDRSDQYSGQTTQHSDTMQRTHNLIPYC